MGAMRQEVAILKMPYSASVIHYGPADVYFIRADNHETGWHIIPFGGGGRKRSDCEAIRFLSIFSKWRVEYVVVNDVQAYTKFATSPAFHRCQ